MKINEQTRLSQAQGAPLTSTARGRVPQPFEALALGTHGGSSQMQHGGLACLLRPSGADGHAAAPSTIRCGRREAHGSLVDVGASACLSREAPRGRAADGMVIRRSRSAFSDVDITPPPVRITGGD